VDEITFGWLHPVLFLVSLPVYNFAVKKSAVILGSHWVTRGNALASGPKHLRCWSDRQLADGQRCWVGDQIGKISENLQGNHGKPWETLDFTYKLRVCCKFAHKLDAEIMMDYGY